MFRISFSEMHFPSPINPRNPKKKKKKKRKKTTRINKWTRRAEENNISNTLERINTPNAHCRTYCRPNERTDRREVVNCTRFHWLNKTQPANKCSSNVCTRQYHYYNNCIALINVVRLSLSHSLALERKHTRNKTKTSCFPRSSFFGDSVLLLLLFGLSSLPLCFSSAAHSGVCVERWSVSIRSRAQRTCDIDDELLESIHSIFQFRLRHSTQLCFQSVKCNDHVRYEVCVFLSGSNYLRARSSFFVELNWFSVEKELFACKLCFCAFIVAESNKSIYFQSNFIIDCFHSMNSVETGSTSLFLFIGAVNYCVSLKFF